MLKPMQRVALLFGIAALVLATTGVALSLDRGGSLWEVVKSPAAHEPVLVFMLPGLFLAISAITLSRLGEREGVWPLTIGLGALAVAGVLVATGWVVVALIVGAPALTLIHSSVGRRA